MIVPFFALASLIAFIPTYWMLDGLFVVGAASAILALALAVMAIAMPGVDLGRLGRLMQPVLIVVLVAPAAWMALQVLPMPAQALANDIWASGSSALKRPLGGAVTIDIGATLLSLAQYCAVAAAAIVTAAIALDRKRAENILYILVIIATLVAFRQIASELFFFDGFLGDGEEAIFISAAGAILSCAAAIQLYDRQRRSARRRQLGTATILALFATALTFAICGAAVLIRGDSVVVVATSLGIGVLGALFAIRRWRLGLWGKAGLATAAAIALFCAVSLIPQKDEARTSDTSPPRQTANERMLLDAPLVGSGAGTYAALAPIYRDASRNSLPFPTGADVIVIEMGRGFFDGMIVAGLFGSWLLFRRALTRQQDYAFAGCGAAMAMASAALVFVSGGIFRPGGSLLAGVMAGLAFGQSLRASPPQVTRVALQTNPANPDDVKSGNTSATPGAFDRIWARSALAVLALVLAGQATWILGGEIYAPGRRGFTQDASQIGVARDAAQKAAQIAVVRGDLWADSAWAQMVRRDDDTGVELRPNSAPASALKDLNRAVRYAPHRSDAWLLLALLAGRYKPAGYDADSLLKMSYYTAPNDLELLPLRLNVALSAETKASDSELQDMIQHDINLVLTSQPELRPALVAAYRSASPERKRIAERLIEEFDPGYLETIRTP